ncbi:hypothetical protein Q4S45_22715 [Massilia sp. R2A-15]|uniref:hypothetical protein n=1 Tax=Massilia sp. R2A-15 TaxID=3064278 RepID=UPI002734543D|nr:hypothetical protein [Massilia sp. R2A-15]WLI89471.1 hypothetical protein Q4S45_22715 [Massilia sp. R2A-15]
MGLRLATEISIRAQWSAQEPLAEVVVDSVPTHLRVSGSVLEAAVHCDGMTLLLLTDDVPYEDMLSIYLLGPQLQLLDSARIGAAYATGNFSGLTLVEPNRLRFRFIDDAEWWVEILPAPSFRLPLVSEVKGVTRSHMFSRHFLVGADRIGGRTRNNGPHLTE